MARVSSLSENKMCAGREKTLQGLFEGLSKMDQSCTETTLDGCEPDDVCLWLEHTRFFDDEYRNRILDGLRKLRSIEQQRSEILQQIEAASFATSHNNTQIDAQSVGGFASPSSDSPSEFGKINPTNVKNAEAKSIEAISQGNNTNLESSLATVLGGGLNSPASSRGYEECQGSDRQPTEALCLSQNVQQDQSSHQLESQSDVVQWECLGSQKTESSPFTCGIIGSCYGQQHYSRDETPASLIQTLGGKVGEFVFYTLYLFEHT